jgi:hypothetical protein
MALAGVFFCYSLILLLKAAKSEELLNIVAQYCTLIQTDQLVSLKVISF